MALHPTTRAILIAFLFTATSLAQTTPPQIPPAAVPCPNTTQPPNQTSTQPPNQNTKPCTPPPPKKSVAEQFPFPGETSKPPASAPDSPAPASTPPPNSPSPTATPSDAAAQHPFPTTPPPKLPDNDSSSSSSSSADDPTMPPDDVVPTPTTRHRLPKVEKVQSDDERVDEDISIAKFYMNDENYQGAYLRAQDAIKIQPDYPLAHFTLAQVAQKMKKKDEAVAEYQVYLKLDPDGDKAKAAKQALAELK